MTPPDPPSPVRIVVLGAGRIGRMHAEMLARQIPGAALAGVYDIAADAAASVADDFGCPAFATLDDALAAPADAVAICTSTDTHVDAMVAAAAAGRHIFCEKPVSLDLAEVDRGLAAVAEAGVSLQVGFNRRFDPNHRALQEAVAAGAVGDLEMLRITSRDPGPPPIEYIAVSGGIFRDMTIHDFDMARFVTGSEVVEVYAKGAVRVDPAIGEAGDVDTAVLILTHANGVLTTIDNSRRAAYGYDQRVEAFGSLGMMTSRNVHERTTELATAEGYSRAPLEHFFLERYETSYLDEWAEFVSAISSGTEPPVGPTDARAPLLCGLAAWRSVEKGRPVLTGEVDT